MSDGHRPGIYEEAVSLVRESGTATTSLLQRQLMIGYAEAARIMDLLEERGVVGPFHPMKGRVVIAAARVRRAIATQSNEEDVRS